MLADQMPQAVTGQRNIISNGAAVDMAALMLDERGMVCDCNHAGESLFKYRSDEMVLRHISMLLPQLAKVELMQNGQINPRLRFLCRIGGRFLAVTQDGERFASEIFLNLLDNEENTRLSLIVRPVMKSARDSRRPATGV